MKPRGSLLLVDDDRQVLSSMADWLRSQAYEVDTAMGFLEGKERINRKAYDVAILDIRLGDDDGFDLLTYCRQRRPATTVIMITGYGTVESAVEAIRMGAFDFLTKPLIDDELQMALERA
ncbi:MAG: response regulator, partial [Thermoguttaceae bacterium]|nr:response regulator [Thermoguttaceae bacterium]